MSEPISIQYLDTALAAGEQPIAAFRQAARDEEAVLKRRFAAGEPVSDLVHGRARLVDALLVRAWKMLMPEAAPASLLAVGGYGRGELHPASDVDLMILTGNAEDAELNGAIVELITFLWDIGLEVGHSVRTPEACVEEARRDLSIVTNLMESRLLIGDAAAYERMMEATGPQHLWPSDAFFLAKWEEQQQRHRRYDDTAYKLEPNIKGSPGGLRDIQNIAWVSNRHFGTRNLQELVNHGFLTEQEYATLREGEEFLWRIRFALHTLTGRHEDRLLFDYQRTLATQFGYENDDASLAVEKFMQAYYRRVMDLARLSEILLQHFRETILLQDQPATPVSINRRFQARNGYLEIKDPQIFARYPLAMLEVFLLLQQHPELEGIRASTIRLIRAHRHLIDENFRSTLAARSLFLEIFRQPEGLTHALRRMNRYGILAAYLPAFARIVGRMQYDLYHVYTVDEHTLMLVRNLRRLSVPEHRDEYPLLSEIISKLPKPELIYIAGLFHDIAKGRGGDHSTLGAVDALEFCARHGLSDDDGRLVAWLVENHLVMSMTAQRRDIDDPQVIQQFAEKVGDGTRLNYLYLLTVCDMRATNPQRWNTWKGALMQRLYNKTRHALARGLDNPQAQDELIQEKQREARRLLTALGFEEAEVTRLWRSLSIDYFLHSTPDEILWQSRTVLASSPEGWPLVTVRPNRARGGTEVFICTPDRDNLFALTTQVLDQLGLNIMDARIQTTGTECTMNSFVVLETDGGPVEDSYRIDEIKQTLSEAFKHNLAVSPTQLRRTPRQLKYFDIPTEIGFTDDPPNQRTLMRLRTADRPGLLSLVGQVFGLCGIRLISAKISTIGEQVEDIFLVTDRQGAMVDGAHQHCIEQDLRARLDQRDQQTLA